MLCFWKENFQKYCRSSEVSGNVGGKSRNSGISWGRNVKYIWRRNSEGSRSLIARTCSNESGPSCNWILTPWFNDSYQKVLACVLSVEWWPIFVFMGIHCWAGAFLVNLYFIDEWRLLTCKQVPSLLQLHTSNVIKAFPVSRKLTSLLQQIHLGFSGGYAYTYQQYTPLGTLSMQRNTLLGVYMENAEKELFLWHGVVKAQWAPLRIGCIFTFWFSVCDLYKGNPYAFHNFCWATEFNNNLIIILTLKPQVDRGSSTMAEPVIVWKTDKS